MIQDKLYICILDGVPDTMVPVLVAHSVLRHHLSFNSVNPRYDNWLKDSFKKCVVSVNKKEFSKILNLSNTVGSCEETVLNGETSCVTIIAHKEEHNVLKYAKLWLPNKEKHNDL